MIKNACAEKLKLELENETETRVMVNWHHSIFIIRFIAVFIIELLLVNDNDKADPEATPQSNLEQKQGETIDGEVVNKEEKTQ